MTKTYIPNKYHDYSIKKGEKTQLSLHKCSTCGKTFYVYSEDWAYKVKTIKGDDRKYQARNSYFCSYPCYKAYKDWENAEDWKISDEEWKKSKLVGDQTRGEAKCHPNHDELWHYTDLICEALHIGAGALLEKLYCVGAVNSHTDWDAFFKPLTDGKSLVDFVKANYNKEKIREVPTNKKEAKA